MRKKRKISPPEPVPPEYRSDLCASCPVVCEKPFRPDGCPYGIFEEDENIFCLVKMGFDEWQLQNGFPRYDEP